MHARPRPPKASPCVLYNIIYCCLFILLSTGSVAAQIGDPARADTATLRGQFDEMLRVSNRFQTYKVVREPFLQAFMTNVQDSISTYTSEISELNATISAQASKVQEQTSSIAERDAAITALEGDKESINLLGMPLPKDTYSKIMWTTILVLFAGLVLALFRMRYATGTANEANEKAAKLAEELETSKRRRLEVEQNLRRQLQDELNRRN